MPSSQANPQAKSLFSFKKMNPRGLIVPIIHFSRGFIILTFIRHRPSLNFPLTSVARFLRFCLLQYDWNEAVMDALAEIFNSELATRVYFNISLVFVNLYLAGFLLLLEWPRFYFRRNSAELRP